MQWEYGILGIDYLYLGNALQGSLVFLIAMVSSIIIVIKKGNIKHIYPMFFILGAITCFVDLLTTPVLTLGLPLIVYFLCLQKQRNIEIKETVKIVISASISWGIGFLLIWFTKWIIVDLLYNKELIKKAFIQISFRTGINEISYIKVIGNNIRMLKEVMFIIAIISFIIIFVKTIVNRKEIVEGIQIMQNILPYIITLIIPFAWYFVVKEHSYEHAFFTYRNMAIAFCSILIIAIKIAEKPKKTK